MRRNKADAVERQEPIAVSLSFRQEVYPAWYAVINALPSGRAAAEILRAHLNPPSEELLSRLGVATNDLATRNVATPRNTSSFVENKSSHEGDKSHADTAHSSPKDTPELTNSRVAKELPSPAVDASKETPVTQVELSNSEQAVAQLVIRSGEMAQMWQSKNNK